MAAEGGGNANTNAWLQALLECNLAEDADEEAEGQEEPEPTKLAADASWTGHSPTRSATSSQPTQEAPTRLSTPTLREILHAARPDWSPSDLSAARSKLGRVGVNSVMELAELVVAGNEVLNRRLTEGGMKAFNAETIAAVKSKLSEPEVSFAVERAKARVEANSPSASLAHLARLRRPGLGEVVAVRTSQKLDEKLSVLPTLKLSFHSSEIHPTVVVDTSVRYQKFLGFGGSFTESSADVLLQLGRLRQTQVVEACFNARSGLGYRMGRIHINSCDFSKGNWSCTEGDDEKLATFTISRYKRAIIPFMHRATASAGEPLKILASPWSPPASMKDNNSMVGGGSLKLLCREAWASHYVRFAKEFEAVGLPLWGVTVQNEANAAQAWESCTYTAEQERDFVRDFLGPALERNGLELKLLVWDHNRDDMFARARVIYSDPEAARHVWGVAFHWYGDPRYERWPEKSGQIRWENCSRVHELAPEKHLIMTEACQEGRPTTGDWLLAERYAENIMRDLSNWTEAWIDWNLMLDDTGGPNHKRNFCSAPLLADVKNDHVLVQPCFYYIGHFSRYVQPGAERILSATNRDALEAIAFANPDGTIAVVVMNRSEKAIDFWLVLAEKAAATLAPEHSITTYLLLDT